jgi:Mce-associated membrane protein
MSSEETNSPVEKDDEAADVTVVETEDTDATETGAAATGEAADSDESAAESKADDQAPGAGRRVLSWAGHQWVALLIAVLLVASAGAAGGVYWWMYRPDRLTDTAAQQQAVNAARDGTVALLSYAPDTLDKDLANAKGHLTGEFLKYYSQFTDQIVAPAAKQKGVKTEATVARAAVSEMHPDNAVVLVFVNQVTTSKDRPDPALATSSVVVKLTKNDGRWLISEFNPV